MSWTRGIPLWAWNNLAQSTLRGVECLDGRRVKLDFNERKVSLLFIYSIFLTLPTPITPTHVPFQSTLPPPPPPPTAYRLPDRRGEQVRGEAPGPADDGSQRSQWEGCDA